MTDPPFNRHAAFPHVNRGDDLIAVRLDRLADEGLVQAGLRADDHLRDPGFQVAGNRRQRPDAAAGLHRDRNRLGDLTDDFKMARRAGERAVEVDHVQALGSLAGPLPSHRHGILSVNDLLREIPLDQPNHLAALQIDCRNDDYEFTFRKFSRIFNPHF